MGGGGNEVSVAHWTGEKGKCSYDVKKLSGNVTAAKALRESLSERSVIACRSTSITRTLPTRSRKFNTDDRGFRAA